MRIDILNKLKTLLPEEVVYHTISHTLNVEKVALKLAQIEGLNEEETQILQTAVLYHDAGYIVTNINNEVFAIQLAKNNLPKYGYDSSQIDRISEIISYTKKGAETPKSILQKIMQDADHDYFGRADYLEIASKLRLELENYGNKMSEKEWILYQLDYLENIHQYYTETSKNIRLKNKNNLIDELKRMLLKINE
jgi:adenylate cyclase